MSRRRRSRGRRRRRTPGTTPARRCGARRRCCRGAIPRCHRCGGWRARGCGRRAPPRSAVGGAAPRRWSAPPPRVPVACPSRRRASSPELGLAHRARRVRGDDRIVAERGEQRGRDVGKRGGAALHTPVPPVQPRGVEHVLKVHLEGPEPREQRDRQRGSEDGRPDGRRRPSAVRESIAEPHADVDRGRRVTASGPKHPDSPPAWASRVRPRPRGTRHAANSRRPTTATNTTSAPAPRSRGIGVEPGVERRHPRQPDRHQRRHQDRRRQPRATRRGAR